MAKELIDGEPADVVTALGRVAWGAISLEDHAVRTAEMVLGVDQGRTPIRLFVDRAKAKLEADPSLPGAGVALDWLARTNACLTQRNQVMHSIPTVQYPGDGETFLVHWPNAGGDPVTTSLNAKVLHDIADRFQALVAQWPEVAMAIEPFDDDQLEP